MTPNPTRQSSMHERRTLLLLLSASLLTSAVHFVDNAVYLDLYPGPLWLTRRAILLAWLALPVLAWVAYCVGTRMALAAYALIGFLGFTHFLMSHGPLALRCLLTIWAEAVTSTLLLAWVLRAGFDLRRHRL